jgi:ABC-2 type transport system ATP-binding protein
MNHSSFAIEADGLSLLRDSWTSSAAWLLDDVSLQIPEGAVVGLVGRNGAGKSTLIRCLLGLTPPNTGSSRLLGCPSLDLSDAVRERLGYVGQEPDLFGWLNGNQHLQEMAALYANFDIERAMRLALKLDLPMGRRADKLSGGDQQKLAVVLAMGHDPDLLILDEPVASLDPISRRDFMRALFTRPADQAPRTVLLSSHLLGDLERVVSHVLFLRQGRVQLFGEWDGLSEQLLRVSVDAAPPAQAGLLHWSATRKQAVVDSRLWTGPRTEAKPMGMDELFEALNT